MTMNQNQTHSYQLQQQSLLSTKNGDDEFEIIKPRLLAIYDQIDMNLNLNLSSHLQDVDLNELQLPNRYLITFYTRDKSSYYGVLYKQDRSSDIYNDILVEYSTKSNKSNFYTSNDHQQQENNNNVIIIDSLKQHSSKQQPIDCDFYHGHLVKPFKGYLAVTTCFSSSLSSSSSSKGYHQQKQLTLVI